MTLDSAITTARAGKHEDAILALNAARLDINTQHPESLDTVLHVAAAGGHVASVTEFIAKGAKVGKEYENSDHHTALDSVVYIEKSMDDRPVDEVRAELMRIVAPCADQATRDQAFFHAASCGDLPLVTLMIDEGLVNPRESAGWTKINNNTVLMRAIRENTEESAAVVSLLLDRGIPFGKQTMGFASEFNITAGATGNAAPAAEAFLAHTRVINKAYTAAALPAAAGPHAAVVTAGRIVSPSVLRVEDAAAASAAASHTAAVTAAGRTGEFSRQ